jgi:hypothetical protein
MNVSYLPKIRARLGLPIVMALTGAILMTGCFNPESKDTVTGAPEAPGISSAEGFKVLEGMGFAADRIQEKKDGYIVDGDMYFDRSTLAESKALGKVNQRRSTAVTPAKASSLRLAIHSSVSSYNTVLQQSVNNLNSLKTRLHIEIVPSGSGDITVYSDASASCPADMQNQPSTVLAVARMASGGNPGNAICINLDHSMMSTGNVLNRVHALTHEIGHTVGLYHTNQASGTHIDGTATSDAASIMHSSIGVAHAVLSYNDILAFELLYPSDKPLGGTNLDGDTKDDIVVWRPTDGNWFALRSNNNFASGYFWQWGQRADLAMEDMDMDGDGKDDKVIWRPTDGFWHAVLSSTGAVRSIQWGMRGDIPLSNTDIDGDKKDDLVVWRWTDGRWYILTSKSNYTAGLQYNWGQHGDIPVAGTDADRDGKDDLVIWRPSTGQFWVANSASNFTTTSLYNWGQSGDIPVGSSDLDRDGYDDLMVWRPANGTWYAALSSKNLLSGSSTQWGQRGDVPVIGTDIDQDGRRDIVVWRPSTATFHIKKSNSAFTTSVSYVWGQ